MATVKRPPPCRAVVVTELVQETTAIAVRQVERARPPAIPGVPAILTPAAQRLLARWLGGKSPDTQASYFKSAKHFAKWLVANGHARAVGHSWDIIAAALQVPRDEGNVLALEWIVAQRDAGLSSSGIATRCSGVHVLCQNLEAAGAIAYVPRFDAPTRHRLSARERAQRYAGVADAFDKIVQGLELLSKSKDATPVDLRDWALVRMGSQMGLRRIELLRIDVDGVDLQKRGVIIHGKGREKPEQVRLPSTLVPVLQRWLRARSSVAAEGEPALFVALGRRGGGRRIRDRGTINAILVKRGIEFAVGLTPHDLRRVLCTEALARFGPRKAIEITRHASADTVMLYDLEQGKEADAMADEAGDAIGARARPKKVAKKKGRKR